MRTITKAAALQQFRYNWKVASISNPNIKGDTVMKREAWNNFVSDSQAFRWSNPFWVKLMQTVRIEVETYDECRTIWYEKTRLKNPTDAICKRVGEQLSGLNIHRVTVTLAPATV
jgi:hypothetical protein